MSDAALTMQQMAGPFALSFVAVTALVVSDFRGWLPGRYVFKPLAALAFVWLAFALGATSTVYGRWIFGALLLCMAGDLFLMGDSDRRFLMGLVAFLCGHLLFAVGFWQISPGTTGLVASILPVALLLGGLKAWLAPRLPANMRRPVALYIAVIAVMLLLAGATAGHGAAAVVITGAWAFAVSDLAVARRQFIDPSRWNGVWGTPLYFGAQMMLACSIALV